MQWMKRYWDQSFPGGEYDALQRRKGGGPTTKSTAASRTVRSKPTTPSAGNQDKDLFHCLMLSLSLSFVHRKRPNNAFESCCCTFISIQSSRVLQCGSRHGTGLGSTNHRTQGDSGRT